MPGTRASRRQRASQAGSYEGRPNLRRSRNRRLDSTAQRVGRTNGSAADVPHSTGQHCQPPRRRIACSVKSFFSLIFGFALAVNTLNHYSRVPCHKLRASPLFSKSGRLTLSRQPLAEHDLLPA
jgi:hypothetical protein